MKYPKPIQLKVESNTGVLYRKPKDCPSAWAYVSDKKMKIDIYILVPNGLKISQYSFTLNMPRGKKK